MERNTETSPMAYYLHALSDSQITEKFCIANSLGAKGPTARLPAVTHQPGRTPLQRLHTLHIFSSQQEFEEKKIKAKNVASPTKSWGLFMPNSKLAHCDALA